jgi:protein-L-isoaspartate(D-aspartate) O-methyltransferase
MNVEQARFNMIEQQIRTWDVLDTSVLELLAVVKREDFVPAAYRAMAFMDMEIPLPGGRAMLPPRLEARLLQSLAPARHEKALEIGTGSGYMAALLAHKALQVVSYEIHPALAAAPPPTWKCVKARVRGATPKVPPMAPFCCQARSPRCRKRCWTSSPWAGG